MFCSKCGMELQDNANFCKNCGEIATKPENEAQNIETDNILKQIKSPELSELSKSNIEKSTKRICCPKCKSTNLQYAQTESISVNTRTKGFSSGMGCLGLLLMGPLGILCGLCGSGKTTMSTTQNIEKIWVCQQCGNKFKDIDEINANIKALEASGVFSKILYIIFGIFIVLTLIFEMFPSSIFLFIVIVILIISDNIGKKRLEELRKEKTYIEKNAYK